jgi:hypothetical protein
VQYLSDKVDIVVISAEQRSDNIDWELACLRDHVAPTRIVLLEVGETELPQNLPAGALTVKLPAEVGWWPFSTTGRKISAAIGRASLSTEDSPRRQC